MKHPEINHTITMLCAAIPIFFPLKASNSSDINSKISSASAMETGVFPICNEGKAIKNIAVYKVYICILYMLAFFQQ
jgi:cation transporter-like permease